MKMIRQLEIIVIVLAGMLVSQGCALLLVGGAVAGEHVQNLVENILSG